MSLAEELLADLEDDSEEELEDELGEGSEAPRKDGVETEDGLGDAEMEVAAADTDQPSSGGGQTLEQVAKLYASAKLKETIGKIREFSGRTDKTEASFAGPVESNPEYLVLVDANNMAASIDEEIANIHRFAKDIYCKRFPDLETLIVQPLDYLLTAKELGNNIGNTKNNKTLEAYLSQATIMVVSVTASTTTGAGTLNEKDLETVSNACDMAFELQEIKKEIFSYVESRMTFIAPNLSCIIGASMAAKLMGAAGGLTALSKMPANHISLLGQVKKTLSGFSQTSTLPHTGIIYYCEIVQDLPPDIRRKVSRVVGSKCALAARVDACHEHTTGSMGQSFRDEIVKRVEKLQEPPAAKRTKALPTPIEAPKKRRGGRRVRKMKERYAVTELRKQANRMTFGEINEDIIQTDMGYDRGNIGKGGIGGGIRMAQIDERTKVRVSQTLKKNLAKQKASWGGASTVKKQVSGTASSVAFTPLQGLEIVNPQAAEKKVDEANAKYFSTSASFIKVQTPIVPSMGPPRKINK